MSRSRFSLALCASLLPASVGAEDIRAMAPSGLAWERTPEGVAFAPLRGDRFAEPYMAMVELPAGLVSPAHVKSEDMFGIVISGDMTHSADPDVGSAPILGPGSYYHIPAGLAHVSSCVSDVPCVTFLYQPGPFDFVPVTQ